jgi:hypothetical protein
VQKAAQPLPTPPQDVGEQGMSGLPLPEGRGTVDDGPQDDGVEVDRVRGDQQQAAVLGRGEIPAQIATRGLPQLGERQLRIGRGQEQQLPGAVRESRERGTAGPGDRTVRRERRRRRGIAAQLLRCQGPGQLRERLPIVTGQGDQGRRHLVGQAGDPLAEDAAAGFLHYWCNYHADQSRSMRGRAQGRRFPSCVISVSRRATELLPDGRNLG